MMEIHPSSKMREVRSAVRFRLVLGLVLVGGALSATAQFQADIDRWVAQDALDPPQPGAVLFIGSSSIRRWEQLTRDFADYRVVQRGFGGATFDQVVQYTGDIVLPYEPAVIVVWAGTNDIAAGSSGAEVVADYQEFVSTVHAAQPAVQIVYLAIMPTPGRFTNGPEEVSANTQIRSLAQSDPRLHYVDLRSPFLALNPPDSPEFLALFVDDIHLSRAGYGLWTSVIRPQLESILSPNKVFTPNAQTPGANGRVLFDFGPDNVFDGNRTASPDVNGNSWSNWYALMEGDVAINAGERVTELVGVTGAPTGIDLIITGGFSSNGRVNGGLLSPSPLLLGDFAINTATEDFFFSSADDLVGGGSDDRPGGFMLTGLNPDLAYELRFFGSRNAAETRVTEYLAIGRNQRLALLQTSGVGIGADGVYRGNDDEIAEVRGVRPDAFGQIFIDLTLRAGQFAYVNVFELVARLPGDWDRDADVDAADGAALLGCVTGPGSAAVSDCGAVFDLQVDEDVDLGDVALVQRAAAVP